jgi:hypothetical protein
VNLHRQIASTLLLAALFAVLVLVVMRPQNARPAQPPTPAMFAAYARGWVDGAAPPGVYAASSTCTRRHVCTVIVNDGSCFRATITGYAFPGPWRHCPKRPTS